MKRALLTIIAITAVATLSGCAGIKAGYNLAVTPDIEACYALEGKAPVDFQNVYGKPYSVEKSAEGVTRKYTKGSLSITAEFKDGKALAPKCINN